jgi:hypothetical protein
VGALDARYGSQGVLIGDVAPLCNEGVCRHRSLLFKVLCDEAGLDVALARGRYRHRDGRTGAHAWNELHLEDGTVFIFDLMYSASKYFGIKQPRAAKYLDVGGRPMYNGLAVRRAPYIDVRAAGERIGPVEVRVVAPARFTTLHYTLDGSEPTEKSPTYEKPLRLARTAEVRALAVFSNGDKSPVASKTAPVLRYFDGVRAAGVSPGLAYRYYTGSFESLPAFDKLKPEAEGSAASFGLDPAKATDHYALLFTGYIRVPREGIYTFSTTSDDGSRLLLHNECVVDNDGCHGPQLRSGPVALKAGLHPLTVEYFEATGGEQLLVTWQGPGVAAGSIPENALFRPR